MNKSRARFYGAARTAWATLVFCVLPAVLQAGVYVPPDLQNAPIGTEYQLVYVTSVQTTGGSLANDSAANTFVNTNAPSDVNGGGPVVSPSVTWYAVVSYSGSDALTNAPAPAAVYNLSGVNGSDEVAIAGKFYAASAGVSNHTAAIDYSDIGTGLISGRVWTGTNLRGQVNPGNGMDSSSPAYGNSTSSGVNWTNASTAASTNSYYVYAISQPLYVVADGDQFGGSTIPPVPEPAALCTWLLLGATGYVGHRYRGRRRTREANAAGIS